MGFEKISVLLMDTHGLEQLLQNKQLSIRLAHANKLQAERISSPKAQRQLSPSASHPVHVVVGIANLNPTREKPNSL